MRRTLGLLLAVGASAALLLTATAAGGEEDAYEVRAIFDNAGFLVAGEEVRIAGARVGSVAEVDVSGPDEVVRADGTPAPGKAVVVLRIEDPGFQDFRADASCLVRPQSLIGEKFVECEPTQPRAAASAVPPPLETIAEGEPGEGQLLLPLEQNGKAVDLDLVNDTLDDPYRDRFRLILNDLGAGLATRGEELAEIVERSNPALRETNEVLEVIARQSDSLAQLASDSDRILGALARERESVSGFINESQRTAAATAARGTELEQGLERFPGFLRELRSTMRELNGFNETATPVISSFGQAAPSLTRATEALGPFSDAGTGALETLGTAAEQAAPDLIAADPVLRQIRGLARSAQPATGSLARFLRSLRATDGFEYLTQLIFNSAGSVNAFDSLGHFLRAYLPLQNCVDYESVPEPGCSLDFGLAQGGIPDSAPARAADGSRQRRQPSPLEEFLRDLQGTPETPPAPEATPEDTPAEQPAAPGGGLDGSVEGRNPPGPSPEAEPEPDPAPEPEPEPPGEPPAEPESGEAEQDAERRGPAKVARRMRAAQDLLDFLIGAPRPGSVR